MLESVPYLVVHCSPLVVRSNHRFHLSARSIFCLSPFSIALSINSNNHLVDCSERSWNEETAHGGKYFAGAISIK